MVRRLRETCGGCLGRRECGLKLGEFGRVRGGLDCRKVGTAVKKPIAQLEKDSDLAKR